MYRGLVAKLLVILQFFLLGMELVSAGNRGSAFIEPPTRLLATTTGSQRFHNIAQAPAPTGNIVSSGNNPPCHSEQTDTRIHCLDCEWAGECCGCQCTAATALLNNDSRFKLGHLPSRKITFRATSAPKMSHRTIYHPP
jgi:hypothetical protein